MAFLTNNMAKHSTTTTRRVFTEPPIILESKCLSCEHYCVNSASTNLTTFTHGRIEWHITNYCTKLGYQPKQVVFPRSLNNPVGEVPDVIDCAYYSRGPYKNKKPDVLAHAMSDAVDDMWMDNSIDKLFKGKKSDFIPYDRFGVINSGVAEKEITNAEIANEFSDSTTSIIEFSAHGKLDKPPYIGTISSISVGGWMFFADKDFTVGEHDIQWHNPALLVGPHLKMIMTHTIK